MMKCVCLCFLGFLSQFMGSLCLYLNQHRNKRASQALFPQSTQTCASEPLAPIRTECKWTVLIEVSGSKAHASMFGESMFPVLQDWPCPKCVGYFTSFSES